MQQDEIENKTSLMVKWLRFCPFTVEDASLIPGCGTRIPHAVLHTPKIFLKQKLNESKRSVNSIAELTPQCKRVQIGLPEHLSYSHIFPLMAIDMNFNIFCGGICNVNSRRQNLMIQNVLLSQKCLSIKQNPWKGKESSILSSNILISKAGVSKFYYVNDKTNSQLDS